ncbi:LPS export ABC transporter periplasmic protein LptC [Qingshengfaniella alkalisoli]|uniref:Lipopolysaccharide export system protein LptC n=1 Tax=Qingshengfaniella alkalisoli TaxID=2599296 RepID=A0A5B8J3E9_9RHOB|nr:LPS export ABC transporter periplasmic protein LptC [Qingshengfaniella alkalisoli]QDY71248.1 hypothetical protein FPZ52_16300 [Qingshengfaniella alkalisoli]
MARFDNGYSRAVAVAKLVLPLIALAILSTLFLFPRGQRTGEPMAITDITIRELAREQRLGAPSYDGVTAEGSKVNLSAETLRPDSDQPGVIIGTELRATLFNKNGFGYQIASGAGRIDEETGQTTLSENVQITTSTGYRIQTDTAFVSTDLNHIETEGAIQASGPLGQLTAGKMVMTGNPDSGNNAVVVFKDGVRLLYQPGN